MMHSLLYSPIEVLFKTIKMKHASTMIGSTFYMNNTACFHVHISQPCCAEALGSMLMETYHTHP